ncbi:putative peptidase S10, serine carboxypeptidase, alpha/Beta hydrolase [Helianthus annuus]|nr:putative peptidase S10, serine carboxypeptidase, alpha/Beta hydrolase [Helianthus annuus]KAJ0655157.1 putative peptidase S10, serine carboxypeptidase, alpha/Beta hydrolase [Helianthus annuus]KAJ0658864.1 putative peptidase S10, serine carboxypeptidase, alpha/Beta hydrolase [Helianthus annuus]
MHFFNFVIPYSYGQRRGINVLQGSILIIFSHASTSTSANSEGRVDYVGVDEKEDVQLFYYFIQLESDPDHDALMLWITGRPGCSTISGLLYEIGLIQFEARFYNGSFPTLISTPYSWTKMASIIFLDLPVGTGFSYARTTRASHSTDIQLCDQAYEFMRKWFKSHPKFTSNPFYVGGDSNSGNPVPIITQLILDGNTFLRKHIMADYIV